MSSSDLLSKQRQRSWAWLWLAYTGFLFIDPLVRPSLRLWTGTLAVFAAFLVIFAGYIRATDSGTPVRSWMIVATFVLGLVTFPWNPGATTFFIYAACFLPFTIESKRTVLGLFVVESLIIFGEGLYFQAPGHLVQIYMPNVYTAIFLLMIIGGGNILFAEQKRSDCKLRLAQEENVKLASLAERERIARDLHDVLGHTLSVIVLKTELAGRLIERDPARAAQEIGEVEKTARSALAEVREAIGGYRSQGLAAELDQARRTLDAAGVTLHCDNTTSAARNGVAPVLSATEETVLSLAVREAVTNIVRHAAATECRMRLAMTSDGFYSLVVEDDGHNKSKHEGNGLRGMRQRVQSLGGRFTLDSTRGTCVRIELPLTNTATREA